MHGLSPCSSLSIAIFWTELMIPITAAGTEALFADLGHFNRHAVQLGFLAGEFFYCDCQPNLCIQGHVLAFARSMCASIAA